MWGNIKYFEKCPSEELRFLESNCRYNSIKKGEYFVSAGDICNKIGIIKHGILRSYVFADDKEFNIEFYYENNIVSAFTSFLTEQPSAWAIQAIEDSEIFELNRELLERLYKRHSCWINFGKDIFEFQTVKKCKREKSLIGYDAAKRYELFREEYKEIENRISQYHIALYLGITPETLSRIRKKYFLDLHQ